MRKRLSVAFLAITILFSMIIPAGLTFAADEAEVKNEYIEFGNPDFTEKIAIYEMKNGSADIGLDFKMKNLKSAKIDYEISANIVRRKGSTDEEATLIKTIPLKTVSANAGEEIAVNVPAFNIDTAGYYVVEIEVKNGGSVVATNKATNLRGYRFGVVYPPHDGIIRDSIFGIDSRTHGLSEEDSDYLREIGRRIGQKWTRHIDYFDTDIVKPTKDGPYWGQAEIDKAVAEVKRWEEYGIKPFPLINYNMVWNILQNVPGVVFKKHQNRPDDMQAQVDMVYQSFKGLAGHVDAIEIWNEPWIGGWTWKGGTAEDYRDMSKRIYETIRADKSLDSIMIIGGGSTAFARDIIYPKNENGEFTPGYMDGTVGHPYRVPSAGLLTHLTTQLELNKLASVSGGKGGVWQSEFATSEESQTYAPKPQKVYELAKNIAPLYLLQLQAGIGYDVPVHAMWFALEMGSMPDQAFVDNYQMFDSNHNDPRPTLVSFAAMTQFVENRKMPANADLYPDSKNIFGYLLPDNATGKTNVALYTDFSKNGTINLKNAKGIKVYDYLGTPLFDGSSDSFSAPFKFLETIYIVSDLDVNAMKQFMDNNVEIALEKPLLIYPLPFVKPIAHTNTIDIDIENASAEIQNGTIELTKIPEGFTMNTTKLEVKDLKPGEKRRLSYTVRYIKENSENIYNMAYTADFGTGAKWSDTQALQVSYAPKKSISVDGSLNDWNDVTGVTMSSNGTIDFAALSLNPDMREALLNQSAEKATYSFKTAWDDDYFYMSAYVPDKIQFNNPSFNETPNKMPFDSDSMQIGFHLGLVNNDNIFKHLADKPGYEKYYGPDMNYEFSFRQTASENGKLGSEIERLCADGTNYEDYYPGNPWTTPKLGPIAATENGGKDGKIVVRYDLSKEAYTYEAAIAWENLALLKNQIDAAGENSLLSTILVWCVKDPGGAGSSFWAKEANMLEGGAMGLAPRWGSGFVVEGGRPMTPWGFGSLLPQDKKIVLNGNTLALDVAPIIENDRTLVPLRAIFEALESDVSYDEATRTVTATKGDITIVVPIDSTSAIVNGTTKTLDVPAKIKNGRTLVPVRFVSENLGATVSWDQENQTVIINN